MKNFPHQFSDIVRLSNGLAVLINLYDDGQDVSNDEIVGIELARAGIYTFRDRNLPLEDAIRVELQKPRAQRGSHTAARDLRRIFTLLGFITDQFEPTEIGRELVDVAGRNETERVEFIWRGALAEMTLVDVENNLSHPYQILKRLVKNRPGINKKYLALALEALNDSDEEFNRIIAFVDQDNFENALEVLGISEASAANAVKILPAIAEHLGDIIQEGEQCYPGIDYGEIENIAVEAMREITVTERRPARRHRNVNADQIAPLAQPDGNNAGREPEEYLAGIRAGIEQRRERTANHQALVREFATRCTTAGFALMEDPFDCLAISANVILLAEMKTLDGSRTDEKAQVQQAFAQLEYYRYFDLPENINRQQTTLIAVFDREISQGHQEFLESKNIFASWKTGNTFSGTPQTIRYLQGAGIQIG
jgi:hypothetical protein